MAQVTIEEASAHLSRLIHDARQGEEIVITENDRPVATLTPLQELKQSSPPRAQFGSGKGLIVYMAPDFDAPLEDFKEYSDYALPAGSQPLQG